MSDLVWGTQEEKDADTFMTNWYKAKIGRTDIVRVVTNLARVGSHNFKVDGKFRVAMCSKDQDGECPFCSRARELPEHQYKPRFAVAIFHLLSKVSGGNWKPVLKLLAWRFSAQQKNTLSEIHELHQPKGILKTDLVIKINGTDPSDEVFQKTMIQAAPKDFLATLVETDKYAAQLKAEKKRLDDVIREYKPTAADLQEYVDRVFATEFEPESFEAEETEIDFGEKKSKKVKSPVKIEELSLEEEVEESSGDSENIFDGILD